jgi:hypothetical protein
MCRTFEVGWLSLFTVSGWTAFEFTQVLGRRLVPVLRRLWTLYAASTAAACVLHYAQHTQPFSELLVLATCTSAVLQALGVRVAQPMDVMQLSLLPSLASDEALTWPADRLVAYLAFPVLAGLLTQLPAGTAAAVAVGLPTPAAVTPATGMLPAAAGAQPMFSSMSAAARATGAASMLKSSSRAQEQQLQLQQEAWLLAQLAQCAVVATTFGNVRMSSSALQQPLAQQAGGGWLLASFLVAMHGVCNWYSWCVLLPCAAGSSCTPSTQYSCTQYAQG